MKQATAKRRHVTVRQLMTLQRNQARYARAATDDPDLLLKDIEAAHSEARSIFKQAMGGMQEFLTVHSEAILGRLRGRMAPAWNPDNPAALGSGSAQFDSGFRANPYRVCGNTTRKSCTVLVMIGADATGQNLTARRASKDRGRLPS